MDFEPSIRVAMLEKACSWLLKQAPKLRPAALSSLANAIEHPSAVPVLLEWKLTATEVHKVSIERGSSRRLLHVLAAGPVPPPAPSPEGEVRESESTNGTSDSTTPVGMETLSVKMFDLLHSRLSRQHACELPHPAHTLIRFVNQMRRGKACDGHWVANACLELGLVDVEYDGTIQQYREDLLQRIVDHTFDLRLATRCCFSVSASAFCQPVDLPTPKPRFVKPVLPSAFSLSASVAMPHRLPVPGNIFASLPVRPLPRGPAVPQRSFVPRPTVTYRITSMTKLVRHPLPDVTYDRPQPRTHTLRGTMKHTATVLDQYSKHRFSDLENDYCGPVYLGRRKRTDRRDARREGWLRNIDYTRSASAKQQELQKKASIEEHEALDPFHPQRRKKLTIKAKRAYNRRRFRERYGYTQYEL